MNRPRMRSIVVAVAIVVLFAVPSAWVGGFSIAGPTASTSVAAPATGVAPVSAALAVTAAPHPGIYCPNPFFPWQEIGSNLPVWPITPDQIPQFPCQKFSIDEVHVSLSTSQAGSGLRWTIPVHVPADGAATFQATSYPQFYVGMVVKGSTLSEWRQSYAAVTFQPIGAPVTSYAESVHLFALQNSSHEGGSCAGNELELVWNASYFCERDDVQTANISAPSLSPGDWLNVTFAGNQSQSTGLDIWSNDSTSPADSLVTVLNQSNTGDGIFEPFYNAACPDTCSLQWSVKQGMGLGFGFTMCPFTGGAGVCNSYNDTRFNETNPVEFGIPHFWTGASYNGDYRYFAPQSTSGVCNGNAVPGTLAFCYSQDTFGGTGYYPSFSYNGSLLDFGVPRAWTTQDWGGSVFELLSTGAPNDLTPFYFLSITNSSRSGFVSTGGALNVTTVLQDLGNVRYAGVTYEVNGGSPTSLAMKLVSGARNNGTWTAQIPSGPNGWVNYTINATNNASAGIASPTPGTTYHVQRGPLPTFTVKFETTLGQCGGVNVNGTVYADGASGNFLPGDYPILGVGCYPWIFSAWKLSNGLTVTPTGAISGSLSISASGTITASWKYVRPLDTITLFTSPVDCGEVVLNGIPYAPPSYGTPVPLLNDTNFTLGVTGCGGYAFSGWDPSANLTILGTNLLMNGNGTLTATYVSTTSSYTIIFATNPSTCGGVLFRGAGYTDGESLDEVAGTYSIAPDPCYHWAFLSWATSGSSLSISGGQVTISGAGTITETNYVQTIVTIVTSPSYCGNITFDGVVYTNGAQIIVANNSTHSVFATPCTGTYLFSITGTGGVTVTGNLATVNGSGDVSAAFLPGSPNNFVGFLTDPPTCGSIFLSGIRYTSSNYTYVATGSQATVTAQACSDYGFLEWVTFGGITILNSTAYINGPGAIEAVFRPLAQIFLYTSPSSCGSIDIANVSYPSNTTLVLTEDKAYPLSSTACVGQAFSQWVNSSGALIASDTLTLTSGSVLTAVFLPVRYSVVVLVNPAGCGGVRISGQEDGNGTTLTLSHSTYSIEPVPCAGDHLVTWDLSQGLAVVNTTLWVNGSGSITAVYQPVPPTVAIFVSVSSFAGIAVPIAATVAVLVPPYTYNYTWNFGDGPTLTTPVNFTSHTYDQPGRYVVTVSVTDPYNRTANASTTIQVIAQTGLGGGTLSTLSIVGIGLAVVAVLIVIVIGSRIRRPPADPSPSLLPPNSSGSYDEPVPSPTDAGMEPPKP